MSDLPSGVPLTPSSPFGGTAQIQIGQEVVQALGYIAQQIKNNLGVATSGDVSGTLPGPIAVNTVTGITNGSNAAAGKVGEEIEAVVASGAAKALSTGTGLTITSIALSPGDWDVWGYVGFSGAAGTTVNSLIGSLSLVNNTLDQTRGRWASQVPGGATAFNTLTPQQFACGQERFNVTVATTIFLVAEATFGVSTCSAFGTVIARRRR